MTTATNLKRQRGLTAASNPPKKRDNGTVKVTLSKTGTNIEYGSRDNMMETLNFESH